MHPLEISESTSGVWTVVTVAGEVDVATSPQLSQALEAAHAAQVEAPSVVVDLTTVTFIDSTGLGVLVQSFRGVADRGGELRVVLREANVRRVFEVTSLDSVIPIYASLDDATAS